MIKNQEFSSKVSNSFLAVRLDPLLHLEAFILAKFPIVEVNVCNAQAALVAKTKDGGVLESPAEFNQSFQYTPGLKLIVHLSGVLQKANQLHAKNIAKLYQGPETNIAPENGWLEY